MIKLAIHLHRRPDLALESHVDNAQLESKERNWCLPPVLVTVHRQVDKIRVINVKLTSAVKIIIKLAI